MTLRQAGQGAFGAIGAYFGGPLGFSIGWMVGGWVFGEEEEDQNQIFDPGAQEMPRINQALRGTTMPILFGTNRVSSNIVWQNNFTVLRHESNQSAGGGGKGGGSGGGKGGAKSSATQASYEYKWDLLYHFGMSPVRVDIFGGWLGADRLNDDTLVAISRGSSSSINFFKSDIDRPQNAALTFEEAHFAHAFPTADQGQADNWAHFATVVGLPHRFPYTSYLGIKQLNLGSSPSIPQLSFEIGPGDAGITFDSAYIGDIGSGVTDSRMAGQAMVEGADGNHYLIVGANGGSTAIGVIRAEDGTLTDSITAAEVDALATSAGLDPGAAYTFTSKTSGAAIGGTNYFLVYGQDIGAGSRANHAFVLCQINASGLVEQVGGYQGDSNDIGSNITVWLRLGISGAGTAAEPLVLAYQNSVSASRDFQMLTLPSVTTMLGTFVEDSGTYEIDARTADLTGQVGEYFGIHQSSRGYEAFGWFVGVVDLSSGNYNTRYYFYIGKADVEADNDTPAASDANSYVNTNKATYPNGWIAYFDCGVVADGSPVSISSPVVANADFIDNTTQVANVPFDDAGENIDGTVDDNDDYDPAPFVEIVTSGEAAGATLVVFAKSFTGSEDLTPSGAYSKARLYIFNPISGLYTQHGAGEGNTYDTVGDVGVVSRYNYTPSWRFLTLNQETKVAYVIEDNTSSDVAMDGVVVTSKFGDYNIGGGEDVLPPYIIYEILTNPAFGVGIPTSAIDTTSYHLALQYCDSEDIRVSTIYNREAGYLSHIKLLLGTYGGFLTNVGGVYKFGLQDLSTDPVRVIDNDHLLITDEGEAPVTVTRMARQEGANKVKVNYLDRELEYRQNFIEVNDEVDQDLNGIRPREFPPKFVMSEKTANKIAIRTLWSNLYAKSVFAIKLGPKDSDLEPGDVFTLVDSFHPDPALNTGVRVRLVTWEETDTMVFDVTAVEEVQYVNVGTLAINSAGVQTKNSLFGPARAPANFQMYELPQEFQGANPQLFVGWNQLSASMGARLYVSADNVSFAKADEIQPYAIGGIMADALPARDPGHIEENVRVYLMPDTRSTDTQTGFNSNSAVFVQTHALDDVGGAARAMGGGNIWIGSEMMAYEGVNLIGQNDYRFDKLYRGWGGTHIHAHSSGDFWHKHAGGIFTRPYNEDKIGTTIYYKVTPFNFNGVEYDIASIDAKSHQIGGDFFKPQVQPPIHTFVESLITGTASDQLGALEFKHVHSSGTAVTFTWPDAARQKGYGAGGHGTGLYGRFVTDTTSHQWRVQVLSSDQSTVVRCVTVDSGFYVYSLATNSEDFNGWQGSFSVRVTPYNDIGDALRNRTKRLQLFEQV